MSNIFKNTIATVLACSFATLTASCGRDNPVREVSKQTITPAEQEIETKLGPADKTRPNIIIILADDMGYSDIGCFGGDIDAYCK